MFPIILSDENWCAGKATLHAALPAVRSGHLTEAIAAGLGARQHASIVAKIQMDGRRHAELALGHDTHFVQRLAQLGYPDIALGHFDAAFSASAVPHPIYASFKRGDRLANDSHYQHCKRLGRPMMMVRMARTYAELEWDCITVDPSEETYLHNDRGRDLVGVMFNLFQARAKGAPGKPLFLGSAFTGTIKKLLPETARRLAEDYFRLLYLPLLEQQAR